MATWLYNGEPFLEAPEEAFGFVYLITHIESGKHYVGKKQFWSLLTKKVKGRTNRSHYKKESDWKKYWSSSSEIKEAVEQYGQDAFRREILFLCATKGELTYGEVDEQFKRNVLKARLPSGDREYYNKNILNRFFAAPEVVGEETRNKISTKLKAFHQDHTVVLPRS